MQFYRRHMNRSTVKDIHPRTTAEVNVWDGVISITLVGDDPHRYTLRLDTKEAQELRDALSNAIVSNMGRQSSIQLVG